jgi:hypothetical protein
LIEHRQCDGGEGQQQGSDGKEDDLGAQLHEAGGSGRIRGARRMSIVALWGQCGVVARPRRRGDAKKNPASAGFFVPNA